MTSVAGIQIPSTSRLFLAMVALHVLLSLACVIAGAVAMLSPKRAGRHPNFGAIYFWCLLAVVVSAGGLSAVHWTRDYPLFILGSLSVAAALAGRAARRKLWPGWVRLHIAAMGVSYILMLTAFYVDNGKSLPGWRLLPPLAYWLFPAAIGSPMIIYALLRHPLVQRPRALLLFALASCLMLRTAQAQSPVALNLGDILPDVAGQSPAGGSLRLSDIVTGKTSVVVFSFSKAAGKDAQVWNNHLYKDYGANSQVANSTVIMLEATPRLLRGIIISELKRSLTPATRDKTIVTYRDEDLWKRRLAVADDKHANILLLGIDRRICWRNSAAFSDADFFELKNKIQGQLQLAKQRKL